MIFAAVIRRNVLHSNQERRIVASLRHTQQSAHAQLLHLRLVKDRAFQPERCRHLARSFRQFFGNQQVRRFINQVARQILSLADNAPTLNRRDQLCRFSARNRDSKRINRFVVFFRIGFVFIRLPGAQHCALSRRLHQFAAGQHQRHRANALGAKRAHHCACNPASLHR